MIKTKLLSLIAYSLIWLIRLTCRYRVHFESKDDEQLFFQATKQGNKQIIMAFFHQDELSLIPRYCFSRIAVLISISKDGEFLTNIVRKLGYIPVRGSSSKKAISGLIAAIRKVKEGYNFSMAVDGPKGPIYKVKEGVVAISKKTGVPILPVRAYPKHYKCFHKSWNKAKLPWFFTKIDVYFGKIEHYDTENLEKALLELGPNKFKALNL